MFHKVELCRDKIILSGNAILGIHSNVAGDRNEYAAGHAWVSISTANQVIYLGLWPDGHPRVLNRSSYCTDVRVDLEAGAIPLVSRYYELTQAQLVLLNSFINRPDVWGYINSCAAWATRLLRDVTGESVSAIDYTVFSTPRELGRELQILERRSPTTKTSPCRGTGVTSRSFGR